MQTDHDQYNCVCLPEITQKGVGESVMVCNRSEWLQNRELSGTILPIKTIRAAKDKNTKTVQPWDIPVHCNAYIAPHESMHATLKLLLRTRFSVQCSSAQYNLFDSVFEIIVYTVQVAKYHSNVM